MPRNRPTVFLPTGYIYGFALSLNTTNPTFQLDIGAGVCANSIGSEPQTIENASTITVDLTTSDDNGLDTGSEVADTWYYVWIIYDISNAVVAGLISTSASSPTLPSGYQAIRRIGSFYNDAGGDIIPFQQMGLNNQRDYQYFEDQTVLSGGAAETWSDIDISETVPPEAIRTELRCYANSYELQVRANSFVGAGDPQMVVGVDTSALGTDWGNEHSYVFINGDQTLEYQLTGAGLGFVIVRGYSEHI